jgi:hypothetical protein
MNCFSARIPAESELFNFPFFFVRFLLAFSAFLGPQISLLALLSGSDGPKTKGLKFSLAWLPPFRVYF